MYWFAQTTTIEHHSLDWLNNKNLFLTLLEAGKSKIKFLAGSIPEASFLDLQMAVLPCPCMTEKGVGGYL